MKIYNATIHYELVMEDLEPKTFDTPERVLRYMKGAFDSVDPMKESFWVLLLDRKMNLMGRHMVSLGTVSGSLVHPREVFKPAILASASAVIVSHNHPSGDPSPSESDIKVTRALRSAAEVLDIDLLDHVIIGDGNRHYSFADMGLI